MNDFEYRHLGRLTNVLMVLLLAGALVNAAASISSIMQIAMLNRGFTTEEAEASDLREGIIRILQTGLFVATAIPFGMWIVRAHRNVRALSAVGLEISPGWALGYYFIPIANLWKPYQAMRDLWKASTNPPGWPAVRTGSVLVIWWIVWLLANLGGLSEEVLSLEAMVCWGLPCTCGYCSRSCPISPRHHLDGCFPALIDMNRAASPVVLTDELWLLPVSSFRPFPGEHGVISRRQTLDSKLA
jgi:hypothetical protein